jgi:mono/diheme cytochrome c family protein
VALFALAAPALADEEQVHEGAKLFAKHCQKCHGQEGQGTHKAPPVVGADALPLDPRPNAKLRKGQFHTAEDVLEFVTKNMPAKKGGSLTQEEYEAILAFDLKANKVEVKQKVTPDTAANIQLHP